MEARSHRWRLRLDGDIEARRLVHGSHGARVLQLFEHLGDHL